MRLGLYSHALRVARARQLRGRALRPFARRRFPDRRAHARRLPFRSLRSSGARPRSAPSGTPDPATRLGQFHLHYGEDVLSAARAGDAAGAQALVETWIDANPPRPGDPWHPYPLSTRVGNWIAALTLVPELAAPRLSESLWRQLLHLEHNVEDDILGNHVIRNARALVLGGAAFGAERLTRRGLDLLRRELPEQVLPDGGHYERSPVYHLVVLRDLLEVQAAAPQPWLAEAIERMRAFAAAVQRPDGNPTLFNDGWLDQAPVLELPEPPAGLTVLRDSGFAIVREGPLWLAFRCGPLAPDYLPAHAHADALSFQLWWRGEPVVVDPGTHTYEAGAERDWFRGTAAHSTVCVDGRAQFPLWGAFRSGRLPNVELREAGDGVLEGTVRLGQAVRHLRRLEWDGAGLTVRDVIEGQGWHTAESRLVCSPSLPDGVTAEPLAGGPVVREEAWLSESLGERVRTSAAVVRAEGELPLELGFALRLA